ncbi:MAG: type II secretion system F family protein [Vicinamibacterales bacterium]
MLLLFKIASIALITVATVMLARALAQTVADTWNRLIERYAQWIVDEFDRMIESMTLARAKRMIATTLVVAFVLGFLFATGVLFRLLTGALFVAFSCVIPWAALSYLRWRRLNTIDDQLVDALLLMSNGLKAGLSLQQALELVVQEMKPPIADEFARVVKEIHLGRLTDDALRQFAARIPLEDLRLAVDSVLTLRETGGNLSETFDVIAKTIVERKKVQGKIKAMTAQGMSQGVLICTMPIMMMLIFQLIDPEYMRPFFSTPLGLVMIAIVFALDAGGLYLMFKLVKVDV